MQVEISESMPLSPAKRALAQAKDNLKQAIEEIAEAEPQQEDTPAYIDSVSACSELIEKANDYLQNSGALSFPAWWLLAPALIACVVGGMAVYWRNAYSEWLDKSLSSSKQKRLLVAMVSGGLELVGVSILVETIDFSEVIKGVPDGLSLFLLCFLGPMIILFMAMQYALWIHSDAWDDRMLRADRQVEEAGKALIEMESKFLFYQKLSATHWKSLAGTRERLREKRIEREEKPMDPDDLKRLVLPLQVRVRIVQHAAVLIQESHHAFTDSSNGDAIRVALFELCERTFVLRAASNGYKNEQIVSITENATEGAPSLDDADGNLIAEASRKRKPLVCSDAEKSAMARTHRFRYLSPSQKDVIKSIVAIPVWTNSSADHARYVVCIDSDANCYFHDDLKPWYVSLGQDFTERLAYAHELDDTLNEFGA